MFHIIQLYSNTEKFVKDKTYEIHDIFSFSSILIFFRLWVEERIVPIYPFITYWDRTKSVFLERYVLDNMFGRLGHYQCGKQSISRRTPFSLVKHQCTGTYISHWNLGNYCLLLIWKHSLIDAMFNLYDCQNYCL